MPDNDLKEGNSGNSGPLFSSRLILGPHSQNGPILSPYHTCNFCLSVHTFLERFISPGPKWWGTIVGMKISQSWWDRSTRTQGEKWLEHHIGEQYWNRKQQWRGRWNSCLWWFKRVEIPANHLQEDPFLSSRGASFPIPNCHWARASPQHQVLQEWSKRKRQVYNNRFSHL